MGTTIAGNQHIGTNYKKMQYVWAPGLGGDNLEVELYEEDYIFVYQFNPLHDQRDDGVLAVEFYYYYRKPTSQAFWDYCYDPDYYYIFPFVACYNDDSRWGPVGKWEGLWTSDSAKISLVGRESGWIHVTLHVDEYIWGRFTSNGVTHDNPLYIGIYSPIPVFCWDNSVSGSDPIVPYNIEWDFEEYEDDEIYDLITGGYLEDCYWRRNQINDYPSFYITYRDVTPEAFNYAVTEQSVVNVSSSVARKSVLKKLLSEIKSITGTADRRRLLMRNAGSSSVGVSDSFAKRLYFTRLLSETKSMSELLQRRHFMMRQFNDVFEAEALRDYRRLLFRRGEENICATDLLARSLRWKRQLELEAPVTTEVIRKQVVFRNAVDDVELAALPFASRLFFRTVETVMGLWDWLRGKIREANLVLSLFCPIHYEITLECPIG